MNVPASNPPSARPSPPLATDTKESTNDCSSSVFRKDDFSFMRDFHQIIDLMMTGNNQEDIGKAVAQMDERFKHARRVLQELPGLQYVKDEQEAILERETTVLETKKAQLKKYMELTPFAPTTEDP